MVLFAVKTLIAALVITFVSEAVGKFPRLAALIISLPLVSVFSFVLAWYKDKNLNAIASVSEDSFFLIPLTLPFFFIMAYSLRMNLSFWSAMLIGIFTTGICVSAYFFFFQR